MSRLARAVEILEAINEYFQERDGQVALYSDAKILENDVTLKDAIAQCLGTEQPEEPVIPHSQRKRVSYNAHTGWSGWVGKRKAASFESEEAANQWLWGV